jgi:peptide/nickel transport system permease protein
MLNYFIRRLLYAVLTFFGITLATFTLVHAVPGDPVDFFIGRAGKHTIPPALLEHVRHANHLDEPLPQQYLRWVGGIVTLDFGRSIADGRLVTDRILEKLPNTFVLNTIAFLLAALIGVPIGMWSATRSGHLAERASAVGFFLLYSLPSFWVALLLMQFFSVKLGFLPLFGMTSDAYEYMTTAERVMDRFRHLVLPVTTATYAQLAVFARYSKSAVTEVIRQDFITTARAKGAAPGAVLWRHAFRNALIPMITLLGMTVPYLISGSVIIEQIFQWDGVGLLYYTAILTRDYPLVMGLTVATAMVTLVAALIADLLYAIADPRIRLGEGASS